MSSRKIAVAKLRYGKIMSVWLSLDDAEWIERLVRDLAKCNYACSPSILISNGLRLLMAEIDGVAPDERLERLFSLRRTKPRSCARRRHRSAPQRKEEPTP